MDEKLGYYIYKYYYGQFTSLALGHYGVGKCRNPHNASSRLYP